MDEEAVRQISLSFNCFQHYHFLCTYSNLLEVTKKWMFYTQMAVGNTYQNPNLKIIWKICLP